MRVLLIGGNGFIGFHLAKQLHASGHEVAIFHRGENCPVAPGLPHIHGDRNRLGESREQLQHFAPDVIVDQILSSGEQAGQLMQLSRDMTKRVVALSTADVYHAWGVLHGVEGREPEPLPITENSPLRTTRKLYSPEAIRMLQNIFTWAMEDYDKIAVEEIVMGSGNPGATILRLPMVYGPGDLLHRFFPVLKRIADQRRSMILPENFAAWRGPRGYVENVAHAIALAVTNEVATGRIYNVCEEPCVPELEWQKRIAEQGDWTGQFVVLPVASTPKHLLFPGNAAQHVVVSSDRIRSELGYSEIVGKDEALRRTIAWERANLPKVVDPQQFDYAAEDSALADAA